MSAVTLHIDEEQPVALVSVPTDEGEGGEELRVQYARIADPGRHRLYGDMNADEHAPGVELHGDDIEAAWRRIESHIAYRWGERTVVFTVEGPGDWTPPLAPTTVTEVRAWRDDAWAVVTLPPTALGGLSCGAETYQITATVGSTEDPPMDVQQAVTRLARYAAEYRWALPTAAEAGLKDGHLSNNVAVALERPYTETLNGMARALQYSGAADLLRPYRRLGARA